MSGKASNSKTVAKPKFDGVKLELLKSLALEMNHRVTSSQITAEIQAVEKAALELDSEKCALKVF